ncbi:beta-glucosidase [Nonomuraea sp. NPDC050328]|uniref:beta-glucosidase n=1 Tax=Nonomuraea sp. NPDC050328 TaxID=3364361 RepID=UPI003793400E
MTTDLDALIKHLDLPAKISLLSGADTWSLPPLPEIGLDRLVMSDGPIGVRGEGWSQADPSIALPSPTALAATWDLDLARQVGRLLAQEARRKGVHVLLAPTINLHRSPLGGRHFECYSEDVHLTGEVGAAYVEGVQEGGVATTPKHFVANDFETERYTVSVQVSDKVLREVYLRPFERVVRAGAWGLMTAYNSVNGTTMSEHSELVNGVLKDEWGFDGYVVSDWNAVRTTEPSAFGGTDVAMPGPKTPWGDKLAEAVRAGRVPESVIDDKVRRILRLAQRTGALRSHSPAAEPPQAVDGVALAREVATRSFTLLTNNGVLPLPAGTGSVAVIGSAAAEARIMGGGSAVVFPDRTVSPLEGLREYGGAQVRYALGTDPNPRLNPLKAPATGEFVDAEGTVLAAEELERATGLWISGLPEGADTAELHRVRLRVRFVPEVSGEHLLSVQGIGPFSLTVDGETVYEGVVELEGDDPAAVLVAPPERRVAVPMTAGVPYELVISNVAHDYGGRRVVVFSLGHADPRPDEDALIAEAAGLAAASEVAVVVAGTTMAVESEGFDRKDLRLPGRQDELISAVARANPRTVVVVNSGSPVEMPWVDEVAAVLLVWFPGQEAGAALAEVLYGEAEPGGRLPTTWPVKLADCPVADVTPVDGAVPYDEGVYIGYRAWARHDVAPAFWFGHGLGYTTWSYDAIEAEGRRVAVTVTNTGARRGREVVQVYTGEGADRVLAGFGVVEAEPGQSVRAELELAERAFQVWADGWRTVEGTHRIEAGGGYDDPALSTSIRL